MFTRSRPARALALGLMLALTTACQQAAPPAGAPAKPAESKPAESKPAEAKPAATTAPAPKAAEAKPAAAGTVTCADSATTGSGGAPIKIGSDGSFTGATANFGVNMRRGIEICLKEFN